MPGNACFGSLGTKSTLSDISWYMPDANHEEITRTLAFNVPSGGSILHPSRCIYSPIQRPVTVTVYANHLPHAQWWISYTTEFSVGISVSAPESCSQLLWRSSAGVIRDTLASGYRELGVQSARDYPRRNASAASSVIWRYGRYGVRDFRTVGLLLLRSRGSDTH